MNRRDICTILTVLLISAVNMIAHAATIGTWKAYMAYHNIQDVVQAGKTIYVLASNGLYTYNNNDKSIKTYDKTNGLNDCDIDYISYNTTAKRLIIIYSDYNIDLMDTKGNFINLSDYYSASVTGGKTINSIYEYGQYAYLSTIFGIIQIDVANAQIKNTYNLGFNVNWTTIQNNYIYAYSNTKGQYRASLTANLSDKNSWLRVGDYDTPVTENKDSLKNIISTLNPGGPKYNYFGFMKFYKGSLYTCGGGFGTTDLFRPGTIQVLKDNNWTIYEDDISSKTGYSYQDITSMDIDPLNNNHIFASGRTGLYEFNDGNFIKAYSNNNTDDILQTASTVGNSDKNYVYVSSISYDKEGNLWGFNSISPSTNLFEYTKDGVWTSKSNKYLMYTSNRSLENISSLFFDSRDLLWMCNNHWDHPYLFCYQPSTENLNSYTSFVNEDGTIVDVTAVQCIAEDLDNNLWIGTNVGPLELSPSDITNNVTTFEQVKVPRNDGTDLADYLLSGVNIKGIAIDGAGRKWFATASNGAYLISEDNNTQLEHFTTDNSPLLSDNIESIAINNTTGEVYFGTDKGLCSYMGDATAASENMSKDKVWAYPNPVKPSYTGNITILGLSYDADIKITTSNGILINEGRSNGGTYVWNGNDLKGKRVASGIYMVETATSSGEKGTVCKIAIIN